MDLQNGISINHLCTLFFLITGTRESAFVHALASASVSHTVTRSCSSGRLSQCGCDRTVTGRSPRGFEWAGCSDNIAFGSAFSRTFVDARERARGDRSSRALMNLHNNEAGRQVCITHNCPLHSTIIIFSNPMWILPMGYRTFLAIF